MNSSLLNTCICLKFLTYRLFVGCLCLTLLLVSQKALFYGDKGIDIFFTDKVCLLAFFGDLTLILYGE